MHYSAGVVDSSTPTTHHENPHRVIVFYARIDTLQPVVEPPEPLVVQHLVTPARRITELDLADVRGTFSTHRDVVPRSQDQALRSRILFGHVGELLGRI